MGATPSTTKMIKDPNLPYPGQKVTFGDHTYIMPDLPYAAYDEYDAFEKISNMVVALQRMAAAPFSNPLKKDTFADARLLLFLAIRRNYPNLTEEEFRNQLNVSTVLMALNKLIDRELEVQGIVQTMNEKNVETQTVTEPKTNIQK